MEILLGSMAFAVVVHMFLVVGVWRVVAGGVLRRRRCTVKCMRLRTWRKWLWLGYDGCHGIKDLCLSAPRPGGTASVRVQLLESSLSLENCVSAVRISNDLAQSTHNQSKSLTHRTLPNDRTDDVDRAATWQRKTEYYVEGCVLDNA